MPVAPTVFVVEDDEEIGLLVADLLAREGFLPVLLSSGEAISEAIRLHGYPALVILDLMMPGEDGISICRRLRATGSVPILILTAKNQDTDIIVGLEVGADDYLVKPFNSRILLARIRAILRRAQRGEFGSTSAQAIVRFGDFTLDLAARRLTGSNKAEIRLLSREFELLSVLVAHPQTVLSRDQLMDLTRGHAWEAFDRSIDVIVSRLRKKIEADPARPALI